MSTDMAAIERFLQELEEHRQRRDQFHRTYDGSWPRPRAPGPSKWAVVRYWRGPEGSTRLPVQAWDTNGGEPCCMACGLPIEQNGRTLETRWNKSGLERAHLTAHFDGGDFTAENLVLLCSACHEDSDRVAARFGPEAMLRWIANHEPWTDSLTRHLVWATLPELAPTVIETITTMVKIRQALAAARA